MTPWIELSIRFSCEDYWKIVVIMTVRIADSTAENDHRLIQQTLPSRIFRCFHFLEKIRKLLDVKPIDLRDLFHFFGIAPVVGKMMMTIGNPDFSEAAIGSIMSDKKTRNPGRIALKRKHHHVVHDADVISISAGNSLRRRCIRHCCAKFFRIFNLPFHFENAGQIFFNFLLVGVTQFFLKRFGILHHIVKQTALMRKSAGLFFRIDTGFVATEQFFKNKPGINFRW